MEMPKSIGHPPRAPLIWNTFTRGRLASRAGHRPMQKETEIKLRVSRATLEALQEHPLLKKRNKSGWERRELYNQYY
ncbi:inorganic triphosphatase, partial [Pseudomonas aeruginosa]|nr:inorganic triphosphatase [Pseudomonas aeruginosa]